jgi:aminoglycoside 3-N-acetyltransferase I
MAASPEIRRLTTADVALMCGMMRLFGDVFEEPQTYHDQPPDDAYLARLLERAHVVALVALDDAGAVVGGLTAYILDKPEQARSEVYVYDLAVDAAHRRRGIATALIRAAGDAGAAAGAPCAGHPCGPRRRRADRALRHARPPRGRAAVRHPGGEAARGLAAPQ